MRVPYHALQIGLGLIEQKLASAIDMAPFLEGSTATELPTVTEYPHKSNTARLRPPKIVTTR
jgi:hypothetical protein